MVKSLTIIADLLISSDSLNFIKNYAHNLQRSVQNKNVGSLVHKAEKLYH